MPADQCISGAKVQSPFENLNDKYRQQNSEMDELVSRLRNRLHSLSDTNFPQPEQLADKAKSTTQFNEGYLMSYNNQLERQQKLIKDLQEQVLKLESLI